MSCDFFPFVLHWYFLTTGQFQPNLMVSGLQIFDNCSGKRERLFMPSRWKEIGSGSDDGQLVSQLTRASLSCDMGYLLAIRQIKKDGGCMEGTWGCKGGFAMRGHQRPEKGAADIMEKFRRYSRRAGDTTVGWHRAYINPEFPRTCVISSGVTSWDSPRHAVQQLCLCTNACQTAVLPMSGSYHNF